MDREFPSAVPEIPVESIARASGYYERCLGFSKDWGRDGGGIGQVSRGRCRLFLTEADFRASNGSLKAPVVIWLNLDNKGEVDVLHAEWSKAGARILSPPQPRPWHLHEFMALDVDDNVLRVFHDFAWELPNRGGREE